MMNPYMLERIIKDISTKSLNCRLLSNTFIEEVDNRKFVYNKDNTILFDWENHDELNFKAKFYLGNPYFEYKPLECFLFYDYDEKNYKEKNNFIIINYDDIICKEKTVVKIVYHMCLRKGLDPKKYVMSKKIKQFHTIINQMQVYSTFDSNIIIKDELDYYVLPSIEGYKRYRVTQSIIVTNKNFNRNEDYFKQFRIKIRPDYTHDYIYDIIAVKTDNKSIHKDDDNQPIFQGRSDIVFDEIVEEYYCDELT